MLSGDHGFCLRQHWLGPVLVLRHIMEHYPPNGQRSQLRGSEHGHGLPRVPRRSRVFAERVGIVAALLWRMAFFLRTEAGLTNDTDVRSRRAAALEHMGGGI